MVNNCLDRPRAMGKYFYVAKPADVTAGEGNGFLTDLREFEFSSA